MRPAFSPPLAHVVLIKGYFVPLGCFVRAYQLLSDFIAQHPETELIRAALD